MSEKEHLNTVGNQTALALDFAQRYQGLQRDSVHEMTNFYIEATAPNAHVFIIFPRPYFVRIAVIFFVASFLTFIAFLCGSKYVYFPAIALGLSVMYIAMFWQHDYVVRHSYPVVWRLPKFQTLPSNAMETMKKAKCRSRLLMFLFIISFLYNLFVTIICAGLDY